MEVGEIMNIADTKSGLIYTHRMDNQSNSYLEKEVEIEKFLRANNIKSQKKFRDIGHANPKRPGLNAMIKYLIHSDKEVDLAVFYSFNHVERDRLQIVLPRIEKYVTNVIVLDHNSGPLQHTLVNYTLQQNEVLFEQSIEDKPAN